MKILTFKFDCGDRLKRLSIVALAAWCAAAVPSWGETIKGTVRYAGAPVENKKLPVTIDQYVCGKEKDAEELVLSSTNGIRNAVVSLRLPPGVKAPPASAPVTMDQKQCAFVPRVVVVPVGGTVEFLNDDRLLHNVKSASKENPPFNRAQPHARSIAFTFKKPEILRIDCDLHSWMRGWVVVTESPFYAVTNDQGEFSLDNIPPGKYTLEVWQETLGTVTQEVVVRSKGAAAVTVTMPKK
jgi:plastocyanin